MSYATRQDLIDRFGADEVAVLDPGTDAGTNDGTEYPRIAAALADAAAEIDAVLAPVYSLPLPAGRYPLLVGIACDIARSRLYDDAPTDAVRERAQRSRSKLKPLATGRTRLLDDAGTEIARRAGTVAVTAGRRVFTDEAFEGYADPEGIPDGNIGGGNIGGNGS